MALARLAFRRVVPSSSLLSPRLCERAVTGQIPAAPEIIKRFSATPDAASGQKTDIAVTESGGEGKLRKQRRRRSLWRNTRRDHFVPSLHDLFGSGIGNAVIQQMNRVLENLSPWRLMGRMKEQDECYKLRFEMPGLQKEEVKITVEDGMLRIRGEHSEESSGSGAGSGSGSDDDDDDDEAGYWSSSTFGYYDTSLFLPSDAKADEIKAELKNGVLRVIIPRSSEHKKDVKEVQVQ